MPDLYSEYTRATASRIVRYRPDSMFTDAAIWDPPDDPSFPGARPVFLFEQGGARQKRGDLGLGSSESSPGVHTVAGMMTNELGAYVIVLGTPPGGIDFEAAELTEMEFAPDCWGTAALGRMFLRANADNPAVCGSTRTMQRARRYWCAGGESAGVWNQLGCELTPIGDFDALVDRMVAIGQGRFRYDHDHTCGHFFGYNGQNRLSSFGEYVVTTTGDTTYVSNGTNNAGASTLGVTGEALGLKRHNRISVVTTTSYTTTGSQTAGTNALAVTGSSTPIPAGCFVTLIAGGNPYEAIVGADFAGGTGSIDLRQWNAGSDTITAGTAIQVRQEFAVTADYGGGTGSVGVWPTIQFPIAAASAIVLLHPAGEGYLEHSWAVGYGGTASLGRVWRSDHSSGRGIPLEEKRTWDVDSLAVASNPRCKELNLYLASAFGDTLQRVDSLTHERSFWLRRNVATLAPLAEYIDLHDEGNIAHLLHQLYVLGNVNCVGYLGDRRSNVNVTNGAQPWLLGRAVTNDPQVLKAYLTTSTRFGGAFA